ncbi:MAG: protein kinase [Lentimicrobium sp.]|nr:protein kinase [Lentimicrobium sp.]
MKVKLEIIKGPEVGRSFEFTEPDTFLVGRAKDATFRLPEDDPYVSRRHFHLEIIPPKCIFRDLESTNTPSINNKFVLEKELENGDIIEVGYTRIKVSIDKQIIIKRIKCTRCGVDIVLIGNEKPIDYCDTCIRNIEEEKRLKSKLGKYKFVCQCGTDLTDTADSDHRAQELKEKVLYSCPKCLPQGDNEKGTKISEYEVIKKIGEGGMGKVYLVYHKSTARIVVCKKILGITQKELLPRFEREISLQKSLKHENIIHFIDYGTDHKEPYMICEYATGGDLNNYIKKNNTLLPIASAVSIIGECLKGLEFMHSNQVIHRDIKPENILLQKDNSGRLIPKIADFGIAKSYNNAGGSSFTKVGVAIGTMFFMAPEQMKDAKNVDGRADIYSFGVSLYYLLTGKYPYHFPTPLDLNDWMLKNKGRFKNKEDAYQELIKMQQQNNPMLIILSNKPIPIRQRNPDISQKLASIVDKAIEKDLFKRIQTAKEFREKLQNL